MRKFERFIISRAPALLKYDFSEDTSKIILKICENYLDNPVGCVIVNLQKWTRNLDRGNKNSGNHGHKGIPGFRGGSMPCGVMVGGTETDKCTGFANLSKLKDHADRHMGEFASSYGITDRESYLESGCDFLSQATGGDVIGYTCADGKVVRFNTVTNQYTSGYPLSGTLCTYMIAKINKSTMELNTEAAMKYYNRAMERDNLTSRAYYAEDSGKIVDSSEALSDALETSYEQNPNNNSAAYKAINNSLNDAYFGVKITYTDKNDGSTHSVVKVDDDYFVEIKSDGSCADLSKSDIMNVVNVKKSSAPTYTVSTQKEMGAAINAYDYDDRDG